MPFPILTSATKLSYPQPFFLVQKSTNKRQPRGSILYETIKSSRSIIVVPAPRGCTPDKTLYPRTAGIQSTDITKRLTNDALFLLQLNKSIVIAIIFSYTAITVDNAANAINIKNNTSHITPPGIWLNTLGSVMNNNDGPAPGLIP